MIPIGIVVGVVDVGFFLCALITWLALRRRGVNGPGQIALGLLVLARLAELAQRLPDGLAPASPGAWLLTTAFSFIFVYTIYQMGRLIEVARDHLASYQPDRQALRLMQVASRPGRPRRTQS